MNEVFVNAFSYLVDEYGFDILNGKNESWGYELEGKNTTTGIRVIYEYREAHAKVMLFRLIGEKIIDNTTRALQNGEKINGFSLEHIIALLNPDEDQSIVYPAEAEVDEQDDLLNYLVNINTKLIKYAANILEGDFSLFEKLDKSVRQKYQTYYNTIGR